MDKKQKVGNKNNFRGMLDKNKITLQQLKEIFYETSPRTLEGFWYRKRVATSVFYSYLKLYSQHYKKRWKI